MADKEYTSFAAFWPFYLREHSLPQTRALHYIGTSLVVALAVYAVISGTWWLLAAMPVAGYFFAWIAHFRVEKNRPATFTCGGCGSPDGWARILRKQRLPRPNRLLALRVL